MADLTDDIVYQVPNEPEIIGKEAVRKWVAEYFSAYQKDKKWRVAIDGWSSDMPATK
jgi:hypothetical protein